MKIKIPVFIRSMQDSILEELDIVQDDKPLREYETEEYTIYDIAFIAVFTEEGDDTEYTLISTGGQTLISPLLVGEVEKLIDKSLI